MSKYLKVFQTHEEYVEYLNSPDFQRPNVTRCIESFKDNDVHYNPRQRVDWYDDEFKRIALNAFNGGREMTWDDLNAVTQERWTSVVHNGTSGRYATSIFRDNASIHSIKDVEKFTQVHTLGDNTFLGCNGIVGDLVVPSNISCAKRNTFNSMSGVTNILIDHELVLDGSEVYYGPQAFGQLKNVSGLVDLRNLTYISTYHEFDSLGANGSGCQVIMPALNQAFGVWFASAKVTAMAGSENDLVNGTAKIPEGYTHGGIYGLHNNGSGLKRIICPESMETFDNFCGGDGSWNYYNYFEMGSNTRLLKGAVCSNYTTGPRLTIVCKASTPPIIQRGGTGLGDDSNYPFMSTNVVSIYVPDASIQTYEQSSTISDGDEIGWARFAGKFHGLSELNS